MKSKFNQKAPNWPGDAQSVKSLERFIELEEIGDLDLKIFPWPFLVSRYLVTSMKSNTSGRIRTATVVTITNQSRLTNRVAVNFFRGLTPISGPPDGTCFFSMPPGVTIDFVSRDLPSEITTANSISTPELNFHEGRAVVSSWHPEIGVSSRVVYTSGNKDDQLLAITDSNIVVFGEGNHGD